MGVEIGGQSSYYMLQPYGPGPAKRSIQPNLLIHNGAKSVSDGIILLKFECFYFFQFLVSQLSEDLEAWKDLTKLDHLWHGGNPGQCEDQPTAGGGNNQPATCPNHCPALPRRCPNSICPLHHCPLLPAEAPLLPIFWSFSAAHFQLWPKSSPAWFTIAFNSITTIIITKHLHPCHTDHISAIILSNFFIWLENLSILWCGRLKTVSV